MKIRAASGRNGWDAGFSSQGGARARWNPEAQRQCGARPLNGGCLGPQPTPLGSPEQMSVLELPGLIGNLLLGRAGPSRAYQLPSFSLPLSTLAVSEIGRNNHCSSQSLSNFSPRSLRVGIALGQLWLSPPKGL